MTVLSDIWDFPIPELEDAADLTAAFDAFATRLEEVLAILGGQHIGTLVPYAGTGDPPALGETVWLLADGRLVSKITYADYFAEVGHAHNGGVDPGSNQVRLPDARGRVIVGADNMGTAAGAAGRLPNSNRARGENGGEERHALTSAEGPDHTHSDGTLAAASHQHYSPWPFVENGGGGNFVGAIVTPDAGYLTDMSYAAPRFRVTASHRVSAFAKLGSGGSAAANDGDIGGYDYERGDLAAAYDILSAAAGSDVTGATGLKSGTGSNGTAHNVLQPYEVDNYLVRVK